MGEYIEVCLYKGKEVCAYNILNSNYALKYELKKELRIAGAKLAPVFLYCSIDSVIGDKSGFPITKDFLDMMHM